MIYFVYKMFIQQRKDYGIISHIKNLLIFKLYKFFVDFRGEGVKGMSERVTMRQHSTSTANYALLQINMVIQAYHMG